MKVWRSGVARQWTMFIGAVFFMISDALIGINMFYAPVPHHQVTNVVFVSRKFKTSILTPFFSRCKMSTIYFYPTHRLVQVLIMSTYHIAQLLIAMSAMREKPENKKKIK